VSTFGTTPTPVDVGLAATVDAAKS
jgi:hypothetical protein